MTNAVAFSLFFLIVGAIAVDLAVFGSEHMIFLGRKFFELLEWIAFWR